MVLYNYNLSFFSERTSVANEITVCSDSRLDNRNRNCRKETAIVSTFDQISSAYEYVPKYVYANIHETNCLLLSPFFHTLFEIKNGNKEFFKGGVYESIITYEWSLIDKFDSPLTMVR